MNQKRILIVDDDGDNRELLEIMLSTEGFVLMTAADGEQALALAAQHVPDLILLDIMMPGLDGYQLAARFKGDPATRHVPIMMLSALDDRTTRTLARTAGAEDFITKPLDRAELCARVRSLLHLGARGA